MTRLCPHTVVVEKVPTLLTRKVPHPDSGRAIAAASLLAEALADRFVVFPLLCDLAHYVIPQQRKRAFLTFNRRDTPGLKALLAQRPVPYPRTTHDPAQDGQRRVTMEACVGALGLPGLAASSAESA